MGAHTRAMLTEINHAVIVNVRTIAIICGSIVYVISIAGPFDIAWKIDTVQLAK